MDHSGRSCGPFFCVQCAVHRSDVYWIGLLVVIQKPQRALRVAQASTRMKLGRHRASSVVQDIAALAVVSSIARPVRIKTQQAHRTVCHARKENTKIKKGNRSVKIARQAALRNWKLH